MDDHQQTTNYGGDFSEFLPEEVVYNIMSKLGPKELCTAATVNKEVSNMFQQKKQ
jgi:hypothetical protein